MGGKRKYAAQAVERVAIGGIVILPLICHPGIADAFSLPKVWLLVGIDLLLAGLYLLKRLPGGMPDCGTGDGLYFFRSPAFFYDQIRDRYVIWHGSCDYQSGPTGGPDLRNKIFYINPDTWAVTVETSSNAPTARQPQQGTYGKGRHIVSQDLYVIVPNDSMQGGGVWVYKPADQSRTYGMQPGAPFKWYSETGLSDRIDHGNGAPNGRAGGTSHTRGNKFQRAAYDTTRRKVTLSNGNDYWLEAGATRGNATVLQIDPSTANATNGFKASAWTSLIQACEGNTKSQLQYPENFTFVYDGPQVGAPTGRDLYYAARGGWAGSSPEICTGAAQPTWLTGEAVLNPTIPAYADAYAAPYNWKTPSWGVGGDTAHVTSGSQFHNASDSYWRWFGNGGFIERHIIGSGNFVRYNTGLFNHGNNETELATADIGREYTACDHVGWRCYTINWTTNPGKLVEIDLKKAVQAPAISGSNDSCVGCNDASHNAVVQPSSSGQDYVVEYDIPGWLHSITDATRAPHGPLTFDEVNRVVVYMVSNGQGDGIYEILTFDPVTHTFTPFPITSTDFSGGYLPGQFPWGDTSVYDPIHNVHYLFGGKTSGSAFSNSPTWTPGSGSFSVADNTFTGLYDVLNGDLSTNNAVFDPVTLTVYQVGVHYDVSDNGTTTTVSVHGGGPPMASTVRVAFCNGCGYFSSVPTFFTMFRPFGGPLVGNAPAPPPSSPPSLSLGGTLKVGAGSTLTIGATP